MPTKKPQASTHDLFGLALAELDMSIHKPNILNYGERDYPEQIRFHKSPKRGRFISGGNRGGKTDAEVVDAIWHASDTHPYFTRPESWGTGAIQIRFVVVDISKGVEGIMIPKFKRWLPKSMLINGSWDKSWDSQNLILTLSNGSTIDFVTHGMDLLKLGGVPRHIVYFDEEPPQHIFNESMMRLVDYNGYWVIAATPTKGMGWTYDLLWEPAVGGKSPWVDTFELDAEQNPYIEAEAEDMDFYMMGMDKEERAIREKGSFVARSGLVFPLFARQPERFIVDEFVLPRGWEVYASVDHGWNNPTAWLWHAVAPSGDIVTFAEHYASEMTVAEHAQVVKAREAEWSVRDILRVGDPAMKQTSGISGTNVIQAYALEGVEINVESIPRDVVIGVEKMQQYFRFRTGRNEQGELLDLGPTWKISSNCPNLIRELKRLRWATYTSEKTAYESNKREEIHKKDDHAFDSARYFATTRPDLRPEDVDAIARSEKVPATLGYAELMAKMREDGTTQFVDDLEAEAPESYTPVGLDWDTQTEWEPALEWETEFID